MDKNVVKVAILSDLHYALMPNLACPERCGDKMNLILSNTVELLNSEEQLDLVLVGGDLINFSEAEEAEELTQTLAKILSKLKMPYTVIRGNHDLPKEKFEKIFPFKAITDVDFVRIVAFDDKETPNYNAERSEADLQRMKEAANFDGVVFSFQHTSLTPKGSCIYSYDNTDKILSVMRENSYRGALSGHFHEGIELFEEDNLQFLVQSALCEKPFAMTLLSISRNGIEDVSKLTVKF